jgi:chitinase
MIFYGLVEDPMNAPRGKPAYHINRLSLFEMRNHCTKDAKKKESFHHKEISTTAEPTFDFMAPFKDYNNKIQLTIQGLASGNKVVLESNFHPNMGWGECFGQGVYSLNISTVSKGSAFETTIVNSNASKTFDLTKFCDIMGTNSGDAVVFPGVAVPIVNSVTVDGTKLKIDQTSQKDPGNGYKIGGYYAQWSVWGRQFNPYSIPFDSVNQLFYAFVGFNPGDGSIKSLDSAADGWGMSAIARAMLKYPYLQTHLSFGGWTNNGQTTAPMFEQLASSQSSINKFSTEAVALMRKLGFSGIDIDWEWWSDYDNKIAPAKKMLGLFTTLRKNLDDASKADGKTYRLSAAVNGGSNRILAMQDSSNPNSVPDFWKQVAANVHQLNIMSYDYHGGFDVGSPAYFQSAYDFSNTGNNKVGKEEGWCIKSSSETYISNGVSAKQLVVGIPLYVRTMQVSSGADGGLFAKVVGTGFGDYEQGILDYKCLTNPVGNPADGCGSSTPISGVKSLKYYNTKNNTDIFNLYGKDAYQPWAYSADSSTFATYDDVWSTTQKVNSMKSRGLGGVMFWELDGDSISADLSLIHTAKKTLASMLPLINRRKYHKDSKNKIHADTKEERKKLINKADNYAANATEHLVKPDIL